MRMKHFAMSMLALALSAAGAPAWAQNVKITPLGTHPGEPGGHTPTPLRTLKMLRAAAEVNEPDSTSLSWFSPAAGTATLRLALLLARKLFSLRMQGAPACEVPIEAAPGHPERPGERLDPHGVRAAGGEGTHPLFDPPAARCAGRGCHRPASSRCAALTANAPLPSLHPYTTVWMVWPRCNSPTPRTPRGRGGGTT